MKEDEDNGINTSNSNYVTNTGNCIKRRKIMEYIILIAILGFIAYKKWDKIKPLCEKICKGKCWFCK